MPRLILILIMVITTNVFANDETKINERARLENVINELNIIRDYVKHTKVKVKSNRRSSFNYPLFDQDIEMMKVRIRSYLNHNTTKPLMRVAPSNTTDNEYST